MNQKIPLSQRESIDRLADAFEVAFRSGQPLEIERLVADNPDLQPYLLKELISLEVELRRSLGEPLSVEEYRSRFPQNASLIDEVLATTEIHDAADQKCDGDVNLQSIPDRIGRYVIQRLIGKGGFGVVYLANDPQLDRLVALKVPRRERFKTTDQVASFIQEARSAAKLKHPGLVTVYDVQEEEQLPYIVQEYIAGENLADWAAKHQPSFEQIVKVLIGITEALGYAHQQGLTHCDLKLANVLMDQQGRPHVADFGLAVHESTRTSRKGSRFGTPNMMAPEQVRGEGHRLDGRTDIWALGVMLYELLVNQKPFNANTRDELFNEIETLDPRPPRQIDRQVPRDLERICLQCLQKRRTDRYNTTDDLREDLQAWLTQAASTEIPQSSTVVSKESASPNTVPDSSKNDSPTIIPKGLRSFDAEDAGFFLDLLPGPRDRDGLPGSIRFWKNRIEENDADKTFAVGLIYGPSGCGKSSLVKAGLLPRLSDAVLPIYVEATAADTEVRILKQLHKQLPRLSANLSLPEACSKLRKTGVGRNRKLLIVIDQFEQWLHAHPELKQTQLVDALRQCEGGHLQTILLVRDDFFASVHRMFQELEYPLLEGSNYALVDRFDKQHSRKVLFALGRAYDKIDDKISEDQAQFIHQAIDQLAEDEKIISVRLALFADMMKSRAWSLASLKEIGGASGVGVTFLEETFAAKTAPPSHRVHEQAIRQVLRKLLPESGTDIKGGMQPVNSLREAAGYQNNPSSFAEVLRILDQERIITPTEPDGGGKFELQTSSFYYQLTHDYLVPSLREWLTRKQRETRKGRAELKLVERSATWNAKPENRYLPSLTEWFCIRTLTDSKQWAATQREMMNRATSFYSIRSGVAVASFMAIMFVGIFVRGQFLLRQEATRIEGIVGSLTSAEPAQIPEIIKGLDGNPEIATGFLSPILSMDAQTLGQKRSQLHARLAMVSRDKSMIEPLLEELLTNKLAYISPIRHQLRPYAGELTGKLRAILREEKAEANRRFRAAVALADFVPESGAESWTEQDLQFVAGQLVVENSEFQPLLRENLRPISKLLLPDLEKIFGDAKSSDAQRLSAANAFADFAVGDIQKLSQLLTVATPEQFRVLYPLVAATPAPSTVEDLSMIAATLPPTELGSLERIAYGQRRANAAVTLLRLGERERVIPVFDMTDDPEALTQFIFRCRDRGVSVEVLLDCLRIVNDSPINHHPRNTRYALMLALGEYTLNEIPEMQREALLNQLADVYRNDPSSGVHGAAGWLLRNWGQNQAVREVDQTAVPYSTDREWFTLAITVTPTSLPKPREKPAEEKGEEKSNTEQPAEGDETKKAEREDPIPEPLPQKTFYYTFVVFPAGESEISSVSDEPDRSKQEKNEVRHSVTLTRPFALLDREITMEELIAFKPNYAGFAQQFAAKPTDGGFSADWYDSVSFCRWLGQQSGMSESDQSYEDWKSLGKKDYPRELTQSANWAPRNWPLRLDQPGFRLPTESEWEVASRSGVRTAFGYGGDWGLLDRFGWFQENSGKQVHPPRKLRPSVRGLFDMHGNVFEWTHDWYSDYQEGNVVDPMVSEGGTFRVIRGGGRNNDAGYCRSALRVSDAPTLSSDYLGFRIALTPSVKSSESEQAAKPLGGGTE